MSPDVERQAVALYRLLAWSSPAFPTGAFSYSHGLEAAVADGAVRDRKTLQQWVGTIVLRGSGRIDADILRDAHRAAQAGDEAALTEVNRRGRAFRATAELALESGQQGAAFLAAWGTAWMEKLGAASGVRDSQPLAGLQAGNRAKSGADTEVCNAAVFGAAAAEAGIALEAALLAYLHAFASNLVSAGLRLGVIGQTDGQRILAALEPEIIKSAAAPLTRSPEEFGSAAFAVDLASMAHETQYTRLFRS